MENLETYKREFSKVGGSGALAPIRALGFEDFLKTGLPTPRTEDWRYADLKLLRGSSLKPAKKAPRRAEISPLTGWPMVFVDPASVTAASDIPGLAIKPVAEVLSKKTLLARYQDKGLFESPLERLNLAFAEAGVFIEVEKNARLPGLEVVFLNTGRQKEAVYFRNLIHLDKGAKANILVRTAGGGRDTWASQVTNIYLEAGAELTWARDFEGQAEALTTVRDFASIEREGRLRTHALLTALSSARYEIEAALEGEGAHAELSGGMLAGENNTIDVLTRVHHLSAKTTSNQTFRGVAGAKGQTAFQGRVRVEENAQKIEAHQNCHNLILERSGEANVKPELLIFADDVICSHGATVGEVDEDALFYMMQRGLSENEARGILVQAFLGEILDAIEEEAIAGHFFQKVDLWMRGRVS